MNRFSIPQRMMVYAVLLCTLLSATPVFTAEGIDINHHLGHNLYSFFLLSNLGRDPLLFQQFYNKSSGVEMSLSPNAYRTLEMDGNHIFKVAHEVSFTERKLPYKVSLSKEWVVLEKPMKATANGTVLLHCRLPLLLTAAQLRERQDAFLAANLEKMRETLTRVWDTVESSSTTGCLYGNGEDNVIKSKHFYILCPKGSIAHIRKTAFHRGNVTSEKDHERIDNKISTFIQGVVKSTSSVYSFFTQPSHARLFEVIGEYDPAVSTVTFDREDNTWKITYPSSHRCGRDYLYGDTNKTWTSTIKLRCSSLKPTSEENQFYWSFNEVKQLCRYDIEIGVREVCEWNLEWDNLRVTPIPCVELQ
ncbi:hypothetical protein, conserved [Angomonas deanei]|uniref:MRH domain-containing protein n=1 Tax=Angomonas deanei TaxID=59799 RepID=A0A7G2C5D8_9TRYP|nr:hypothetical protein, conserved [Angomonas deanei]